MRPPPNRFTLPPLSVPEYQEEKRKQLIDDTVYAPGPRWSKEHGWQHWRALPSAEDYELIRLQHIRVLAQARENDKRLYLERATARFAGAHLFWLGGHYD